MTPSPVPPSRALRLTLLTFAALASILLVAALILSHYAEPIARRQILRSIEDRLGAPATLDQVHVGFRPGLRITGTGLHIAGDGTRPSVQVQSFHFATDLGSLFRSRTTLVKVDIQGLTLTIPPGADHAQPAAAPTTHTHGDHGRFLLSELTATGVDLILQNADPARYPVTFHLSHLVFDDAGAGKPSHFEAMLANPRPLGDIHVHGLVGPCNPQFPRQSPISARFDFAQGDLSSVNGVRGHVRGQGTLAGSIGQLAVEGDAASEDFRMDPGLLTVALTSHYQATLDTLTGAIALNPATAHMLHTDVTATGSITRVAAGHQIDLETRLTGRAEDLLDLVSPTRRPPIVRAALMDSATVHVPPGRERMLLKMTLNGRAAMTNVRWSDPAFQQKVDGLSLSAEDKARQAHDHPEAIPIAASTLANAFVLQQGQLRMTGLIYRLPGATVLMDGTYSLPTETMDFHGLVRTAVPASHLTTGLKSLLLKPLDPFLHKPGAAMQLPISFTGSKSDPQLALDLAHHKSDDRLAPH